jgi:hypothetical protein
MSLGQAIERLASREFLTDLTLERDRMDAVLGHGPYSSRPGTPGQSENIILSGLRGALQSGVPIARRLTPQVLEAEGVARRHGRACRFLTFRVENKQ